MDKFNLSRFHSVQSTKYSDALQEIKNGRKTTHWMWYIFPQIKGLGFSPTSKHYAIKCIEEAKAYLEDPVLASRLREISCAMLMHAGKDAASILGDIDAAKLFSSMTLFDVVSPDDIFSKVLDAFFSGKRDTRTLEMI